MSYKQEKEERKEIIKDFWSDEEMIQFDQELEPYRVEIDSYLYPSKKVKGFLFGGEIKYLEDKGVVRARWDKDWQKVISSSGVIYSVIRDRIKDYVEFQRKLTFFWDWKNQRDFGKWGL